MDSKTPLSPSPSRRALKGDLATGPSVTTKTNNQGIAAARLTLGQKTSDYPTFLNKGKTYSQQVGENIVDATLPSGLGITMPFTALGIPKEAHHIKPAHGGGKWGAALSFAGFVSVTVEDMYDNPVSNVTVTFKVADPVQNPDQSNCPWTDARKTYLTETGLACINEAPTYGTCGLVSQQTFTVVTNHTGAAAQVILGGMEDAIYTISAAAPALSPVSFSLYTYDLYALYGRTCDNTEDPLRQLFVTYTYSADQYGNSINAGKAGTTIPVQAKLYSLVEGETTNDVSIGCGSGTLTCSKVVGSRQYDTTNEYISSSVTFSGITGTAQENGIFTADYTLKPGLNTSDINGTASLDVQSTQIACPSTCTPTTVTLTQNASTIMQVYGIDVQTSPVPIILIDTNGYATQDYTINYVITPAEYQAGTAYVVIYKDSDIVAQIPTERQGQGFATITRGFWFDLTSMYYAQVVLNFGTGVEIRGGKVPIKFISANLRFDIATSSSNQTLAEKVIRINNGDINQNNVPDFADGLDLFGNQGTDASALFTSMTLTVTGNGDFSQIRLHFDYAESDPATMTRTPNGNTYIYTPAPGSLRIWTKNGNVSRHAASIKNNGDYVKAGEEYSPADFGISPTNNSVRLFVEGMAANTVSADQQIRIEIDPDGTGPQPFNRGPEVNATVDASMLIPDYNHNREIDDDDKRRALRGDKFYFWVNDDDDSGETSGSDIPGDTSQIDTLQCSPISSDPACVNLRAINANNNRVNGVRDLIDFFPVYLNIKDLLTRFDPGSYTYKLKSDENSLRFAFTDLKPETAGDYLTGSENSLEPATTLGSAPTYEITKTGVAFKDIDEGLAFLQKIKDDGKGIILLEGRKESSAPLVLAIYDNQNGREVYSVSIKLSLAGVEKMFRHKNLISAGVITDGTSGENNADAVPTPAHGSDRGGEPDRLGEPVNLPDSECNQQNFVFVHGYNVNGQQARGWQAEMFKRMYWAGSRAKFWGVSWYGFRTQFFGWITPDYHINVRHAFNTAPKLAELLNLMPGEKTIAAHSLGNMVVSSAISDWGANVKNYFMVNAAVASEAFYGLETANTALMPSEWNGYKEGLRSTEWYKLFAPSDPNSNPIDNRSKLTWRDRFSDAPLTKFYNFFSSGEDVLTDPWILQENLKGTVGILGYNGADYGGWGFNLVDAGYYIETDELDINGNKIRKPIPYEQANLIPDSDLVAKPFFKRGGLIESLLTDSGSGFAKDNRNRMLSESFPALTSAGGTNTIATISPAKNLNMQNEFKTKINDIPQWPRPDDIRWKHSDVKIVSYLYLYNLFFRMIELGGLGQ